MGNEPPFSFRLAEKKTAVHGQKKRALGRQLVPCGTSCGKCESIPNRCPLIESSPAGCAAHRRLKKFTAANRKHRCEIVSGYRKAIPSLSALLAPLSATRARHSRRSLTKLFQNLLQISACVAFLTLRYALRRTGARPLPSAKAPLVCGEVPRDIICPGLLFQNLL